MCLRGLRRVGRSGWRSGRNSGVRGWFQGENDVGATYDLRTNVCLTLGAFSGPFAGTAALGPQVDPAADADHQI
jgi:hypothetical protein